MSDGPPGQRSDTAPKSPANPPELRRTDYGVAATEPRGPKGDQNGRHVGQARASNHGAHFPDTGPAHGLFRQTVLPFKDRRSNMLIGRLAAAKQTAPGALPGEHRSQTT